MILDFMGRQSGKTYRMVQWVLGAENRVILVANGQRASSMLRQYEKLELNHILLPHQFRGQAFAGQHPAPEIGVDDAVDVLRALAGTARIARISLTPDHHRLENDMGKR